MRASLAAVGVRCLGFLLLKSITSCRRRRGTLQGSTLGTVKRVTKNVERDLLTYSPEYIRSVCADVYRRVREIYDNGGKRPRD